MASYEEVEIKLHVRDLDAVRRALESLGAHLKTPRVYERNVRYDDDRRTLSRQQRVLRLRQDERARLTYKDDTSGDGGGDARSRFEAEVEVSDFEAMATIIDRLGFHPYMVYEKYRTTYTLDDAEIVLDEMPFGSFVEIEGEAETINAIRQRLGLGDATAYKVGYTALFDRVREHLGLGFTDLTFRNFEGIDVPDTAFRSVET